MRNKIGPELSKLLRNFDYPYGQNPHPYFPGTLTEYNLNHEL
jgi:hypothetical protein